MTISKEQLEEQRAKPEVLRSCYNCDWLYSALSWWCSNEKAIKDRGTRIPGCIHCPHWAPDKSARKIIRWNKRMENFMIVG